MNASYEKYIRDALAGFDERTHTMREIPTYRDAIAHELRSRRYGVETDPIGDERGDAIVISKKEGLSSPLLSATIRAKGDPDDPRAWMGGLDSLMDPNNVSVNGMVMDYRNMREHDSVMKYVRTLKEELPATFARILKRGMRDRGIRLVGDWYAHNFGADPQSKNIDPLLTFDEVRRSVGRAEEFYLDIGARDSLLRDRILEGMAAHFGYDVDAVRECWRKGRDIYTVGHLDALQLNNAAVYDPVRGGQLIVSYLRGYDEPSIEVYDASPAKLSEAIRACGGIDREPALTTREVAARRLPHIVTYSRITELISDFFDGVVTDGQLIDVTDISALAEICEVDVPSRGQSLDDIIADAPTSETQIADAPHAHGMCLEIESAPEV